jgi:hypothetical protein
MEEESKQKRELQALLFFLLSPNDKELSHSKTAATTCPSSPRPPAPGPSAETRRWSRGAPGPAPICTSETAQISVARHTPHAPYLAKRFLQRKPRKPLLHKAQNAKIKVHFLS